MAKGSSENIASLTGKAVKKRVVLVYGRPKSAIETISAVCAEQQIAVLTTEDLTDKALR
jgi:hypothetical protein